MKTKILADFQICISAPLNMSLVSYRACWSGKLYFKRSLSPAFCWCHHKFGNASRRQFYGIKFILEKVSLMIWILLPLTSDCHFFLTKFFADISKNNEKFRKSHENIHEKSYSWKCFVCRGCRQLKLARNLTYLFFPIKPILKLTFPELFSLT